LSILFGPVPVKSFSNVKYILRCGLKGSVSGSGSPNKMWQISHYPVPSIYTFVSFKFHIQQQKKTEQIKRKSKNNTQTVPFNLIDWNWALSVLDTRECVCVVTIDMVSYWLRTNFFLSSHVSLLLSSHVEVIKRKWDQQRNDIIISYGE
jgi:hypothetical protein